MGYSYSVCGSKSKQQALPIEKKSPQSKPTENDSRQTGESVQPENIQPIEAFHATREDFIKNKASRVSDDYKIKENIGVGSYGEVKLAVDKKTGEERAVKIIRKKMINPKEYGKLMEEVKIILSLDHPSIFKVYDVYEDSDKYYIVSELLKGGELFDTIVESGHFSEQRAARIMRQLLSAVAYCHKAGVAHRDLKPENILFENKFEDNVKIIDFGFAEILRPNHRLHGALGTVYYIAPEVINDSEYNEKCDIWSCGVILYIMLSGYPPFHGKSGKDEEVLELVQKGEFDFDHEVWNDVSEEAKTFIRKLMEMDPNKRYSGEQALQDPWLTKYSEKNQADRPLAKSALERLSSFRVSSKLQETIWIFLVSYFSSKEDIHNLWQAFKALDTNGDGQLTKEELMNAYIQIEGFGNHQAEEEANRLLQTLDTNHDGKVSYSEFLSAAASRRIMLTKNHLEKAFRMFDKDGDGVITANDLRLLFNSERMQRFPNDLCQRMIEEADKNKQGKIDIKEFEAMMLTLLHNKEQQAKIMQDIPGQG